MKKIEIKYFVRGGYQKKGNDLYYITPHQVASERGLTSYESILESEHFKEPQARSCGLEIIGPQNEASFSENLNKIEEKKRRRTVRIVSVIAIAAVIIFSAIILLLSQGITGLAP